MITIEQITEGAKFKTQSGITWIIDSIAQPYGRIRERLVRTSMEHGAKGNYRDTIDEVVSFLNDEKSIAL